MHGVPQHARSRILNCHKYSLIHFQTHSLVDGKQLYVVWLVLDPAVRGASIDSGSDAPFQMCRWTGLKMHFKKYRVKTPIFRLAAYHSRFIVRRVSGILTLQTRWHDDHLIR